MLNNIQKGNIGESIAVDYLLNKGYRVLELKYRNPFGEIDIIARDNEYIVFIEVKYRNNLENGYPRESVNKSKQKRIRKIAQGYIAFHQLYEQDFRFDVIEILKLTDITIEHIENAF